VLRVSLEARMTILLQIAFAKENKKINLKNLLLKAKIQQNQLDDATDNHLLTTKN